MCHPGLPPDVRASATTGPREQDADDAELAITQHEDPLADESPRIATSA
jgi:hypothetical protein